MAIYLTGDIHGELEVNRLSNKHHKELSTLTKEDFVIVLGDFGCIWDGSKTDKYWLDWLDKKPFTTLFIDGNHECFDLLEQYPVVEFHGGRAHKIRDSIYHLMRGEIFTLENKTFLCCGGADSHDKHLRKIGKTWWRQERITTQNRWNALKNLKQYNYKVDFILSHCAPTKVEQILGYHETPSGFILHDIHCITEYTHWFCGHYHQDAQIKDNFTIMYRKVERLENLI